MKTLIIKTGLHETFDTETRLPIFSFGDVLRSTVVLHLISGEHEWLAPPQMDLLLTSTKRVDKVDSLEIDLIINLENNEEYFSLMRKTDLGFFKKDHLRLKSREEINLVHFNEIHAGKNWSEKLFIILGASWKNERPKLEVPNLNPESDFGFNWQVGPKWAHKDWGKENWKEVHRLLSKDYSISWQEGFDSLQLYLDWIKNQRVLFTHDSLGLHIAQALRIPVVALFGPTSMTDIARFSEDVFLNFQEECHLTPSHIDEILKEVFLRRVNGASTGRQ